MRALHRLIGLIMVAPLVLWLGTGFLLSSSATVDPDGEVFELPRSPVQGDVSIRGDGSWDRAVAFETVLGRHLVLEMDGQFRHVDPRSGGPKPPPSEADLRQLLESGLQRDPERYGTVTSVGADSVITSTGHRILVDWASFQAIERGPEHDRARLLRDLHVFRLTGNPSLDGLLARGLPLLGLILAALGMALVAMPRPKGN